MSRDRKSGLGLCCMRPDCADPHCEGREIARLYEADGGVRVTTDWTQLLEAEDRSLGPRQLTRRRRLAVTGVLGIAVLLLMRKAHAAPAIAELVDRSYMLAALSVALLAVGFAVGFLIGRVLQARKATRLRAYCRVCALLNGVPAGAGQSSRRVRAGAVPPAPCSYSSDHPELTLAQQRRRMQPPPGL